MIALLHSNAMADIYHYPWRTLIMYAALHSRISIAQIPHHLKELMRTHYFKITMEEALGMKRS